MSKHAYLIMAHNEFNLLKKLILLLDDPRNDIYVHVDKKAKKFDPVQFQNLTQHTQLIFIDRTSVSWGGYSQIQCEINLLKTATQPHHQYYHLLSGTDLPLKTQDVIHTFFKEHQGQEFIHFQKDAMQKKIFSERIGLFHPLQEWIGRRKRESLLYQINRGLLKLQEILHIDRRKNVKTEFKKWTTWFSITHNLAQYIVDLETDIQRDYRWTQCADEIFLHTAAWNSQFRDNLVNDSLRMIDWKRGRPYTYTAEDFDSLIQSDTLWARKFSEEKDPEIVEKIIKHLKH